MDNPWDAMRRALDDARDINNAADKSASSMAAILCGRLRHVQTARWLRDLKRELRDFDMTTGEWKSRP